MWDVLRCSREAKRKPRTPSAPNVVYSLGLLSGEAKRTCPVQATHLGFLHPDVVHALYVHERHKQAMADRSPAPANPQRCPRGFPKQLPNLPFPTWNPNARSAPNHGGGGGQFGSSATQQKYKRLLTRYNSRPGIYM